MGSSKDRCRLDSSSDSYEENLANDLHLLNLLDNVDSDTMPSASTQSAVTSLTDDEANLKRMLSLHSVVSPASSAVRRHAAALTEKKTFTKIGAGACGIVFCQQGQSLVMKLAKAGYHDDLWNDFECHLAIQAEFERYKVADIKIPSCQAHVPADDPVFFNCHPGLSEAASSLCQVPTCAIITERIWPLPEKTRKLLIDRFCAAKLLEEAHADPANNDCLVRPYLGSYRGKTGGLFFSLRNFKLHLNQMIDIQLDVEALARRMGVAMALMHWAAKMDARDVEFVLGSSALKAQPASELQKLAKEKPHQYIGPPSRLLEDLFHRTTELWILDFNQVRPITLDDAGIALAVEAATINDPYIPKPLQDTAAEKSVWNVFAKAYITASTKIIIDKGYGEDKLVLPRMFLQGLINVQKAKGKAIDI
ncbi:hypothetical protein HIM_00425 [Hirsutella minnesotensis 3608]|nr:hypothetical protein HIM_00425 [Hirsutella minnesotensis 3608]